MKVLKSTALKGLLPVLTVWLFALYPMLALYAHNADQLMIKQLLLPIVFSLGLGTILFVFWLLIFKNSFRAGLATVIFLIIFWNYGLIYMVITRFVNLKHWHVIPILFFICVHLVWVISKIKLEKTLSNLNTILLAPISLLVVMNLVTIVPAEFKKIKTEQKRSSEKQRSPGSIATKNYPDIYLIILDEYASLKTIKEEWGYDNSAFAGFLRDKGFFVAENSEARFSQTTWNIPSLLNLNYLTGPVKKSTFLDFIYNPDNIKGSEDYKRLIELDDNVRIQKMNNNFLTNYLKGHGYKIIVLEGLSQHYSPFKIQNADILFSYQNVNKSDRYSFLISAFYMELIRKSMIFPFEIIFKTDKSCNINYSGTRYVFNYLNVEGDRIKSPKFIYAHIMCPHGPFVFDHAGNYVSPIYPNDQLEGKFIRAKNTVNAAYLEQYIYASNEIKNLVNNYSAQKASGGPVLIIQCDHGPRPSTVYLKDRTNSFKIFNAVCFPDGDYKNLYDSIAPVNTLRVVLNKYFGENYKMLEDK